MASDRRVLLTKAMVSQPLCDEYLHMIKESVVLLAVSLLFLPFLIMNGAFNLSYLYGIGFLLLYALLYVFVIPRLIALLVVYKRHKTLQFFFVEDKLVDMDKKKSEPIEPFLRGCRSRGRNLHVKYGVPVRFAKYGCSHIFSSSAYFDSITYGDVFILAVHDGKKKKILACYPAEHYRVDASDLYDVNMN